jgi:elongation factor Ts
MYLIKILRAQSGAPIVDCKKAVEQSGGNIQAAMDWLRQHGAARASNKVLGRDASEGLVGLTVSDDFQTAVLVKVVSETDFASRSARFVSLVRNVAAATHEDPICQPNRVLSEETILASRHVEEGKSVKDLLDEAIVAIRENLSVAYATKLQTNEKGSILVGYIHNRIESSDAGTAVALVELGPSADSGTICIETLQAAGKKLAMHIVAARPTYLSPEHVPEQDVHKEKMILAMQLESSGKPADMVEKIVLGRLRKFYETICLTEQDHMIEESNPKVWKVMKDIGIDIKRFETISIG